MDRIDNFRFSKIGTNPKKYFDNYFLFINNLPIGCELEIDNDKWIISDEGIEIFNCNSDATFRQNIDAWIWMGFVIKINKSKIIKALDPMNENDLLEHSKYNLFLISKNSLTNIHRKTIIIKLLSLYHNQSFHKNHSYEEIKKECGKYEELLLKDKKFIELLDKKWGKGNE